MRLDAAQMKLGLVGAGAWAHEVVTTLQGIRGVSVVAIYNRTIEKARDLARKFSIDEVYGDYRQVCEHPDLDGVLVLTHESAHRDPTIAALAAGKGVFVEKPMAESSQAAQEMAATARNGGLLLMPGHVLRFESRCRAARERLDKAGAVRSIRCYQHRPKRCYPIYCKPHIAFSLMVHHLDLCRWFARSPVVAVESRERFSLGEDFPSCVWAMLEFGNGCIATLESGWVFESDSPSFEEDGIEIITEHERMLIQVPSNGLEIRHAGGIDRIDRGYGEALQFELEHWVGCLGRRKESPVISAEEGVEAVALAERVVAAAGKKRRDRADAERRA